jgi:HEAT repeat protein
MKFAIRDLLFVTVIAAVHAAMPSNLDHQSAYAAEPKGDKDAAFESWVGVKRKTDGEYRDSLKRLGLDSKEAIPFFASKIGSDDARFRKAAVWGLALLGNQDVPTALPALLQAAKDTDPGVRGYAVSGLGRIGAPPERAIPAIVAVLEKDESRSAALALGKFGSQAAPAIAPLTKALGYKQSLTRASAAEALGKIGPAARSAAPTLRMRLKDEDDYVRGFAARALWEVEGTASPELIDVLIALLKTEKIMLAIETLGEIGPRAEKALPALEAAGKSEPRFFIAPTIWAAGRIREEKDLLPRLLLELKNSEPMARAYAAWALGKMGPEARETVPALRKLVFDDKIGFGRFVVLEALERIEGHDKATEWIESFKLPR